MPASQNTIWGLVNLGHELDDIASKLDSLAAQLNRGAVDRKLYEETRRQIKKCGQRLDTALSSLSRQH